MYITFSDGRIAEARIYRATERVLRVAISGEADLIDFTRIGEEWVSESCERVDIEFEWERFQMAGVPKAEDCTCSPELAAKLIEDLYREEATAAIETAGVGVLAAAS